MPVVGVVDYHSGNIRSVVNAIEAVGACARIVRKPETLSECSHLVLPGVGAFGFCVERLRESGMLASLESWVLAEQRPLLGICVGMQMMADSSDELGLHKGLGWIGGSVSKLKKPADRRDVHIPHVGWNEVCFKESFGQFRPGESVDFYFDHSYAYHGPRLGAEVASAEHGQSFSAIIRRDNLLAVQFHPEKSQDAGARLLKSFLAT